MRYLLVGDVHAVEGELDECRRLIDQIAFEAGRHGVDGIIFMGDQHHNFKLVNVEVMAFWIEALKKLANRCPVHLLVGNHDFPGDGASRNHALLAYQNIENVKVIDTPSDNPVASFIPYCATHEQFFQALKSVQHKVVLCHNTFDGSVYENGFYAKDGIKLEGLEQYTFISGHIHTPQHFANVYYIGAPRWRSVTDANIDRAIVVVGIDNEEMVVEHTIDTSSSCTKMVRVEDREGGGHFVVDQNCSYIVDIYGSPTYVKEQSVWWAASGVYKLRIRTFPTRPQSKTVSESQGVQKALEVFVGAFRPRNGTSTQRLQTLVSERIRL